MYCDAARGAIFKHEQVCVLFLKYRYNAWFSVAFCAVDIVRGGMGGKVMLTLLLYLQYSLMKLFHVFEIRR